MDRKNLQSKDTSNPDGSDHVSLSGQLIHVRDTMDGITRISRGKGFSYSYRGKILTDPKQLARIKNLVIPPAWRRVWICSKENGHLQATGYDSKDRKQYLYHPLWIASRGKTKFHRLQAFGKMLPSVRKQVHHDLRLKGMPKKKVLAAAISLLEGTGIRIGNERYKKQYDSYGLSTLKDNNVRLNGNRLRFVFTGKKGVKRDISIKNKKLARVVQHCREIPGQHLFQYYDEEGKNQSVHSGDINDYIKALSGMEFTSKDFRTWSGTVECIRALRDLNQQRSKDGIIVAVDQAAECLGNTRSVCRRYYIHPKIISSYESGELDQYFRKFDQDTKWLDREERLLIALLST